MATKVTGIECGYSGAVLELPFSEKVVYEVGDEVVFKDAEGKEEYGAVKYVGRDTKDKDKVSFTSKILRKATPNDIQKVEGSIVEAKEAAKKCNTLIAKQGLDMNVFRSGISFDGDRVHFMFTAEDRVDFRELVKELAKTLKKQIHLRQIGPRDKAKLVGGFGKCGRELCCNSWLDKLESINMEMVRAQALESKGSSKLSGACGKLLCCLKYEVQAYRDLRRSLPHIGSFVLVKKTKTRGKVIGLDILNQRLKVILENGEFHVLAAEEVDRAAKA
jgi:cell fate regulator YaaT (PSP1 superfamily)